MPEWLPALMGQGGALVAVVILGRMGFKFLITLLEKKDVQYQEQNARLDILHTKILEHLHEGNTATGLQTEAMKNLTDRIQIFLDR